MFNEESLECYFVDEFKARGYEHVIGDTIVRAETDILIAEDLRQYLRQRYNKENLLDVEINVIVAFTLIIETRSTKYVTVSHLEELTNPNLLSG